MAKVRAALITGGSSGIGLAVANMLAEEGFALTVASRGAEKLEGAAEALRSIGGEVNHVTANVAEEQDISSMADSHWERFGRLDLLINNAGIGIGGPIEEFDTKKLDMQINVNFRGVYLTTRECIPMLKQTAESAGSALVVNMASIAGKEGQGWLAAYSASKAAVINLTEATQKELGSSGVKATAICPAFVDTPMTDWIKEQVPAEKMIRPADVAETVKFLLGLSPNCIVPEIILKRPGEAI